MSQSYFKFRSRKDPVQSCSIPKSAISDKDLYPKISGKGLKLAESLPEKRRDSRLVWRAGRYYLTVPHKQQFVPHSDNQARIVAIDPGVRIFATCYAERSCGFIGQGDFSRLQRLAQHHKINNLVNELHHKKALFLVKNYD